jgi:hypothetical protein
VTKFTVEKDPSLSSYVGLQGDEHRKKLAETFLRPTTWWQYCNEVSIDGCATDDGIASRPPAAADGENDRMFVEVLYTGHFRATDKNDCVKHNATCTGHIADYPCGWTSPVVGQLYCLNIALESNGAEVGSGGYTYQQLVDMWHAASATTSNLVMYWWKPEALYQEFQGTDAEMQRVSMPVPTQKCVKSRVSAEDRCSENLQVRVGSPEGVCDDPPTQIGKLIAGSLYNIIHAPTVSDAVRSPGYDVLDRFSISELQPREIFDYWGNTTSPREAVCQWAADNVDYLKTFIPRTSPRELREEDVGPLTYATVLAGGFATILVLFTCVMVHRGQNRRAVQNAQVEFLWLLLVGSLMVIMGAIATGVPSTNVS